MATFLEFYQSLDADPQKRGKQFEHFVKWFLKNDPEWSTQVVQVWLWEEYPERWGVDCGIDLVFRHKNGENWAVQAKCYSPIYDITKHDVDKFLSESNRMGIDKRLLIASTDRIGKNAIQVCEFLSYSTFSTNKGKQPSVISSIIEQANKPRHDSTAQSFNIGETIKNETFEVTINSVKFLTNVGGIIFNEKAADGGLFVAIKWKYKNISSKPINMFNAPTLSLLDSNGAKYDNDLGASIAYASQSNDTQKTLSDTNPGITVTGSEVFEVSQEQFDAEKWRLIVKTMDGDLSIKLEEYINKKVSESNEKQLIASPVALNNQDIAKPTLVELEKKVPEVSNGPSFDCSKAKARMEKLICESSELSLLDYQLNASYKIALSDAKDKSFIKNWQFTWLKSVSDRCDTVDCLKPILTERISLLNSLSNDSNISIWNGNYQRYFQGKVDNTSNITVVALNNGNLKITGFASYSNGLSVNDGEIDDMAIIDGRNASFGTSNEYECKGKLNFNTDNSIDLNESGCGGLNVSFTGNYMKNK